MHSTKLLKIRQQNIIQSSNLKKKKGVTGASVVRPPFQFS